MLKLVEKACPHIAKAGSLRLSKGQPLDEHLSETARVFLRGFEDDF